jgi:hypothetical protein
MILYKLWRSAVSRQIWNMAHRLEKSRWWYPEAIETAQMNLRISELKKKQLENDIQIKTTGR